jgi:hypothetical protein
MVVMSQFQIFQSQNILKNHLFTGDKQTDIVSNQVFIGDIHLVIGDKQADIINK